MLRCSDRAQPPWIERPQISTSIRKKNISQKKLNNDQKKWFFFFLKLLCLNRAHLHVASGITCPTAYILDPRVKGHPKKIFSKIKKNKQKKLFFSKKNACPFPCYAVRIAPNRHELNVPRSLHQFSKKKFRKKLEKWPKKMIFLFPQTAIKV